MKNETKATKLPDLVQLDAAERTALFKVAGQEVCHIFSRPSLEDWSRFNKTMAAGMTLEKKEWVSDSNEAKAIMELYDRIATGQRGYRSTRDDWKQRMPLSHKREAVGQLSSVWPEMDAGESEEAALEMLDLDSDIVKIRLACYWNGVEFGDLFHTLRAATVQQQTHFDRAVSRTFRIRGKRRSRIVYGSDLAPLCHLYDELVVGVAGYTTGGEPLTGDRETIVKWMDPWHKQIAVTAFFSPDIEREGEDE